MYAIAGSVIADIPWRAAFPFLPLACPVPLAEKAELGVVRIIFAP